MCFFMFPCDAGSYFRVCLFSSDDGLEENSDNPLAGAVASLSTSGNASSCTFFCCFFI